MELTVAQGLMKRMQNEGFLRQAAKGKRYADVFNFTYIAVGPVVQSWISANPGLNLNCCFSLVISAGRSKLQKKILLILTRFVKKYFQVYEQTIGKFAFECKLTYTVKLTRF